MLLCGAIKSRVKKTNEKQYTTIVLEKKKVIQSHRSTRQRFESMGGVKITARRWRGSRNMEPCYTGRWGGLPCNRVQSIKNNTEGRGKFCQHHLDSKQHTRHRYLSERPRMFSVCTASSLGALVTRIMASPSDWQQSRNFSRPGKRVIVVEIFRYTSSFAFQSAVWSSANISGKSFSTAQKNQGKQQYSSKESCVKRGSVERVGGWVSA